jgi:recombination associated protein RdgC
MTWDERVSFELTEGMQLRKIVFLEGTDETTAGNKNKEDDFDADMAIATGELGQLVPALLDALGGEQEIVAAADAAPAASPAAAPVATREAAEEEEAPF